MDRAAGVAASAAAAATEESVTARRQYESLQQLHSQLQQDIVTLHQQSSRNLSVVTGKKALEEMEPACRGSPPQQLRSSSRLTPKSSNTVGKAQPGATSVPAVRLGVEAHQSAVALLEERRETINCDALEADLRAMRRTAQLEPCIKAVQEEHSRLEMIREELVLCRFQYFDAALVDLNKHLGMIYKQLTGGQGDAYVQYTRDPVLCFLTGAALQARPDSHWWRPVQLLSGGQAALLSMALSFALQAVAPVPLYVLDEVDAALDTTNVERLANYIKTQSSAQYIVVTHRPEMYEQSGLIGVYPTVYRGSKTVALLS